MVEYKVRRLVPEPDGRGGGRRGVPSLIAGLRIFAADDYEDSEGRQRVCLELSSGSPFSFLFLRSWVDPVRVGVRRSMRWPASRPGCRAPLVPGKSGRPGLIRLRFYGRHHNVTFSFSGGFFFFLFRYLSDSRKCSPFLFLLLVIF